jgi:hypothetical protein
MDWGVTRGCSFFRNEAGNGKQSALERLTGGRNMASSSLAISTKNVRNHPVWLEVVADLQIARRRLRQLASAAISSGELSAIDRQIHQIVASLVQLASDGH